MHQRWTVVTLASLAVAVVLGLAGAVADSLADRPSANMADLIGPHHVTMADLIGPYHTTISTVDGGLAGQ